MSRSSNKQVIDIQSRRRQRARSESPIGALIKTCHKFAHDAFDSGLKALFEGADDALFDLAERAQSNTRQAEFFEGMRDVRLKRARIDKAFQKALIGCFRAFAKRQLVAPNSASDQQQTDLDSLALVADSDLEESLAISGMVSKAVTHNSRVLAALNKRLAVVHGGGTLTDAGNPLAPLHIADCFQRAAAELESALTVKLVMFKLFEKYVISRLPEVYDQVNQHLSDAGILPGESAVLSRPNRRARRPATAHSGAPNQPVAYVEDAASGIDSQLMEQLNSLLASRHNQTHGQHAAPQVPAAGQQDLMTALTLLQAEQTSAFSDPQGWQQPAIPLAKSQLISQVSQLSPESGQAGLSTADDDTIELVGMLFEFILRDNTLPDRIKAIISRLQVPLIKVALLNQHLFAQRNHPARRLVDELANVGIGWSESTDRGGKLLALIKDIVEQVLRDFDDDVGVFDAQLARIRSFVEQRAHKVERTEQRTTETSQGRERLENARKDAAKAVFDRLQGQLTLPPIVGKLLREVWPNVLVLKLLRHGEDSAEYTGSVMVVEHLIAVATGQKIGDSPAEHNAALLSLRDEIATGLDLVAYRERDVQTLLDRLTLLDEQSPDSGLEEASEELSAEPVLADENTQILGHTQADTLETGDPSVAALISEHAVKLATADADLDLQKIEADVQRCMAKLQKMEIGSWVEFSQTDGGAMRAKLSWISPISERYLFVNRNGLKICDRTLKELAVELSLGHIKLLTETPLFERAVGAILRDLKVGKAAKPVTT